MKAVDLDFYGKRWMGGVTFYPYQLSLGVSVRYWPCIFTPSLRIHVGPVKLWLGLKLRG